MNPNDPRQQPVAPPPPPLPPGAPNAEQSEKEERRRHIAPVPVWFSQVPPNMKESDFHRDRYHIPFKKIIKRSSVVLLALAIILGTGYGLLSINKETNRLTAAAAADLARDKADTAVNYRGDGSDILKTAAPQVLYECPSGFTKESANSDKCTKNVKTVVSGTKRICEPNQKSKGSGEATKCIKMENGTLQTVAGTIITSCDQAGFTPSGLNCNKKESGPVQKQYLCPTGQIPAGLNELTLCLIGAAGTLRSKCSDASYTKAVSGASVSCSKSSPTNKSVTYPSCPGAYYWLSAPTGYCRRPADITNDTYCPYAGFDRVTTTNPDSCVGYRDKVFQRYSCPAGYTVGATCTKTTSTTQTQASKNGVCPSGWTPTRVDQFTVCKKTTTVVDRITGTPIYAACTYSYGAGWTDYGTNRCRRIISPAPQQPVYYCSLASLTGESLYADSYYTSVCQVVLTPITKHSCNPGTGTVSGANCVLSGTVIYYCDPGFTQRGSGADAPCVKENAPTSPPIVKIVCTAGFLPVGSGCDKTTIVVGKRVPGCEDPTFNFSVADSKCSKMVGGKEVEVSPKVIHECDPGLTPSGSGDNLECSKDEVKVEKVQKVLKCEEGWKKRTASDGAVDCVLVKVETVPVNT